MAADTCRLCLRPIDKAKSSNLLTETTKFAMLKEFLPDMNLDISENTEVCNNCMGELETSYNYKNGVVANEANIQAKLKGKKQKKIDLKLMLDGVAKKELKKGDHICRTCLSICKSPSISLFDSPSNMMPYSFVKEMCEAVFELEFIASAKPVLCDDCWETLQTVYNFRKSCLRIDQRLRTYVASKNVKKLSIDEFKKFAEENPVKEEDEDSSDEEINGYIKDEPIDEEELKIDPEEASCSSSSVKVKDETEVKSESELNSDDEDMEDEPDLLDPKALKSEASEPDGEDCKMEIGDVKVDTEGEGAAGTSGVTRLLSQPHLEETVEELFICAMCNYKTTKKYLLLRHRIIHLPDNQKKFIQCPECPYKAPNSTRLKKHMTCHQSSTDSDIVQCPECTFKTKCETSLNKHSILHRSDTELLKCLMCNYKTTAAYLMKEHAMKHSDHLFRCDQCSYETNIPRQLRLHSKIHENKEELFLTTNEPNEDGRIFTCTGCDFQTDKISLLRNHQRVHLTDHKPRPFQCPDCPQRCFSRVHLRQHQQCHQYSTNIGMLQCSKCTYKTKSLRAISMHSLLHRSEAELLKCLRCNYTTTAPDQLSFHVMNHIAKKVPQIFRCEQCPYQTRTPRYLRLHSKTHLKHDDYKCKNCSYSSSSLNDIKHHQQSVMCSRYLLKQSETQQKQNCYKCVTCSYSNSDLKEVQHHQQNAMCARYLLKQSETQQKQHCYKCVNCSYTSSDLKNVQHHQQSVMCSTTPIVYLLVGQHNINTQEVPANDTGSAVSESGLAVPPKSSSN